MASATKSHVVKVTGVSDDLLRIIDDGVRRQHYGGRAEYIRELIRRDAVRSGELTFREVLAPVQDRAREMSEEELDAFFEPIRDEVHAARQSKPVR